MKLVKPPTFKQLTELYGGRREAVQHLAKIGYSVDDIEVKSGLPRYLVNLYLFNVEPKNTFPFIKIAGVFNRIASLRSIRGKETELQKFLGIPHIDFETKVRLALGRVVDENPRVGAGLVEKAIAYAFGSSPEKVHELFQSYGEYGEVAALQPAEVTPRLTVGEVFEAVKLLTRLERVGERVLHVASLLRVATPDEARYVTRLVLQDLKLGYHEVTVMETAARVLQVEKDLLRDASAVIGAVEALRLASRGGEVALSAVKLRPGQFLKPQLAHLYESGRLQYPVLVEYKYDGSRLQLHKWGSQVWVFSRRGIEKSQTLPEVVEVAGKLNAKSCIVDSEVVAVDKDGKYLQFQYLLERTVPRQLEEAELEERKRKVGLRVRVFDILYLNGRTLTEMPLKERKKFLLEVVPEDYLAAGVECTDESGVMKFYEDALRNGLEGVVVKSLNSRYEVGERTYTWLKFKPERDTVDAVVVKALYGKGRRAGYYSSFLLAVRDPARKKLYTIGKVSNIQEDVMAHIRSILEQTRIGEDGEGVFVKPSVVLEVTYQEVQETDEYTSGYALRVPKFVRVRTDKTVEEIDTTEKMRELYELQYERFKLRDLPEM